MGKFYKKNGKKKEKSNRVKGAEKREKNLKIATKKSLLELLANSYQLITLYRNSIHIDVLFTREYLKKIKMSCVGKNWNKKRQQNVMK